MRAPRKPKREPIVHDGDVEMMAPIEITIGLVPEARIRFGLAVADSGAASISVDLSIEDAISIAALLDESITLARKVAAGGGFIHMAGKA